MAYTKRDMDDLAKEYSEAYKKLDGDDASGDGPKEVVVAVKGNSGSSRSGSGSGSSSGSSRLSSRAAHTSRIDDSGQSVAPLVIGAGAAYLATRTDDQERERENEHRQWDKRSEKYKTPAQLDDEKYDPDRTMPIQRAYRYLFDDRSDSGVQEFKERKKLNETKSSGGPR